MAQVLINSNVEPDIIIVRKQGETVGNRFTSKLGNIVSFSPDLDCTPHTYVIILQKVGYSDASVTFQLEACGTAPTIVADTSCTNNVGTIQYTIGPTGYGNIVVQLKDSVGTPIGNALTQTPGTYTFSNLSQGTYSIEVKKENAPACITSLTKIINCTLPEISLTLGASTC